MLLTYIVPLNYERLCTDRNNFPLNQAITLRCTLGDINVIQYGSKAAYFAVYYATFQSIMNPWGATLGTAAVCTTIEQWKGIGHHTC